MKIYDSATLAFFDVVAEVYSSGRRNMARGMTNIESTSKTFVLSDPRNRVIDLPSRPIRHAYNAASVCYNMALRDDVASICRWNPNGNRISDDGTTFYGANYGQRWDSYVEEAMYILSKDPDSRRAFVPIWAPKDLVDDSNKYSREGKDVPCTIGFALRIIDGALVMQTIMRSQSIVGVMCYDVFLFTALQEMIAKEMNLQLGWYEHHMMSAHIYDRELDIVENVLAEGQPKEPMPMPPLRYSYSAAKSIYPLAYNAMLNDGVDELTDEMMSDPIIRMLSKPD